MTIIVGSLGRAAAKDAPPALNVRLLVVFIAPVVLAHERVLLQAREGPIVTLGQLVFEVLEQPPRDLVPERYHGDNSGVRVPRQVVTHGGGEQDWVVIIVDWISNQNDLDEKHKYL
jgi:hypothetical protein